MTTGMAVVRPPPISALIPRLPWPILFIRHDGPPIARTMRKVTPGHHCTSAIVHTIYGTSHTLVGAPWIGAVSALFCMVSLGRKAEGWYLTAQELRPALGETYESALDSASLETLEGQYTAEELDAIVDRTAITALAWEKIQQIQMPS